MGSRRRTISAYNSDLSASCSPRPLVTVLHRLSILRQSGGLPCHPDRRTEPFRAKRHGCAARPLYFCFFSAHRFLAAAEILARPSGESPLFGLLAFLPLEDAFGGQPMSLGVFAAPVLPKAINALAFCRRSISPAINLSIASLAIRPHPSFLPAFLGTSYNPISSSPSERVLSGPD